MTDRTCLIDGCGDPHKALGRCPKHYARLLRARNPKAVKGKPSPRRCSLSDCDRPHLARGLCRKHYMDWRRDNPGAVLPKPPRAADPFCCIAGCDARHHARGWCVKHYGLWLQYGDPLASPPARERNDIDARFWPKVDKRGDDECWPWAAAVSAHGYGQFDREPGVTKMAHRTAWELHHGEPAPAGMHVCHSCDNPPCCNPAHLFLGTPGDNVRDMISKGRHRGAHAALSHTQVLEISAAVAKEFGVSASAVAVIVRRAAQIPRGAMAAA